MKQFFNHLQRYGATAFVMVGLAIVGITVTQIQTQQYLPTQAAGEDQARGLGIWFDPNPVPISPGEAVEVRLKLDSLNRVMTKARLVFKYDPQQIQIIRTQHGTVFTSLQVESIPGKLAFISEGEFLGNGTWVKIQILPLASPNSPTSQPITLTSDPQLSELQYKNQPSISINQFDLTLQPQE